MLRVVIVSAHFLPFLPTFAAETLQCAATGRPNAMRANAGRATAPGDSTPGSEEPIVIKTNNQHIKLGPGMPASPTQLTCATTLTCAATA